MKINCNHHQRVGFGFEADRPNQVVQIDVAPLGKTMMRMPANDGMAYLKMEIYYEISDSCMANRPWIAAI
jgi:hypothetical protein